MTLNHKVYKKIMVRETKLRYSSRLFLRSLVGGVFFLLGMLGVVSCFAIVNAFIPIENNPDSETYKLIFLGIFLVLTLWVVFPLKKLFDKLFCKSVSLADSESDTFALQIDNECFYYQKSDIQRVRVFHKHGKAALFNQCTLSIKMSDRVFRFASDEHRHDLDEMYNCLDQWKRESKQRALYKKETQLT